MGFVVPIKKKSYFRMIVHKLFNCPSFWKSLWTWFWISKPFYRCIGCNKALHCYWDGNDIAGYGIDYCNKCASELENGSRSNL